MCLWQIPFIYFHAVFVSAHVYLISACYSAGHAFATAINDPCSTIAGAPLPSDGGGDAAKEHPTCPSAAIMIMLSQIVLLFVYLAVLKCAEHLSDAYGDQAFHYDLGVDLDSLWRESQNVLKSMSHPPPDIKKITKYA